MVMRKCVITCVWTGHEESFDTTCLSYGTASYTLTCRVTLYKFEFGIKSLSPVHTNVITATYVEHKFPLFP